MSTGSMGNMAFQQPVEAPGLFTFLWEKYVEHCTGNSAAAKHSSTFRFINFCEQYLSDNRPTLTFVAHNNVGVYLGDQQRVLIAPPMVDAPTGDMMQLNVPNQGAVMITGNAKKQPGMKDMSQYDQRTFANAGGKGQDGTMVTKPEKLDQDRPYTRER